MSLLVGLTYDLRDDYIAAGMSEEEAGEFDAVETIDALEGAIRAMGFSTDRIGNAKALAPRLVKGDRWDLVFNIAEGVKGRSREAQVPALLELYDVPYTMSDPLVCAVTLDKAVSKRLIQAAGLATPAFHVVESVEDVERVALQYPLFAKPVAEGTGKGITTQSRIDSEKDLAIVCAEILRRFGQPVLVEEFLPGREFTVSVLGYGRKACVLGTIEVASKVAAPAYSFESKKNYDKLVNYTLVEEGALRDEVEALGLAAYKALECRDTGRVDVRLDRSGRPSFMEINPLPGLHPIDSDLPITARLLGMPYNGLIAEIVESALERLGITV
jgi:D-alanine-D-alanine ligase